MMACPKQTCLKITQLCKYICVYYRDMGLRKRSNLDPLWGWGHRLPANSLLSEILFSSILPGLRRCHPSLRLLDKQVHRGGFFLSLQAFSRAVVRAALGQTVMDKMPCQRMRDRAEGSHLGMHVGYTELPRQLPADQPERTAQPQRVQRQGTKRQSQWVILMLLM